jgi:hypothetical protein
MYLTDDKGRIAMPKQVFYIVLTDMFCGELNYGNVSRFAVKAITERGAAWAMSRYCGVGYRRQYDGVWHSEKRLSALDFQDSEYMDDSDKSRYAPVNF